MQDLVDLMYKHGTIPEANETNNSQAPSLRALVSPSNPLDWEISMQVQLAWRHGSRILAWLRHEIAKNDVEDPYCGEFILRRRINF